MGFTSKIRSFLSSLPVAKKIELIYTPSVVVLAIFVLSIVISDITQISKAKTIKSNIELVLMLDAVAHNHAVERGLTAGFLGSKGAKGKDKLSG